MTPLAHAGGSDAAVGADRRRSARQVLLALAAALVPYLLLHTRYYRYYIDDAWWVADIHHFFRTGIMEEYLFRTPDAPDRVIIFGKSFFLIYGAFLEWAGWTKSNALLLSSLFIWLSAGTWWLIAGRLRLSPALRKLVPFSILVFPAFFSAAHLARPDALVLFLASLTFYIFLRGWHLIAGFFLLVSMEVHLMGVTGFFFIIAWVLAERRGTFAGWRKLLCAGGAFALGAFAGVLYYLLLHRGRFSLDLLATILTAYQGMDNFRFGFVAKYFVQYYWYRHAWELLLILAAVFVFVKKRLWRGASFPAIFLPVMLVSSFVTSRPNANYMPLVYPAFLVFVYDTFERAGLLRKVLPWIAAALVVLYGGHWLINRHFDFEAIVAETRESLPDTRLPVIGMPDNWFVVPEGTFYPIYPSVEYIPELGLKDFYLVRNDYIGHHSRNYLQLIDWIGANYDLEPVRTFTVWEGQCVKIYRCRARETRAESPAPQRTQGSES
ncbi:MAG: hypothetical protein ACYC9Y_00450 [Candidatus Methylomirabilia bacterium]